MFRAVVQLVEHELIIGVEEKFILGRVLVLGYEFTVLLDGWGVFCVDGDAESLFSAIHD